MSGKEGVRFSQNYLERGEPTSDSPRARRRVYQLFSQLGLSTIVDSQTVELALGAKLHKYRWEEDFFTKCELRDFLDVVTVVYNATEGFSSRREWIDGVAAIFKQESLRYRIDRKGGVHFAIDGEFTHNLASAIAALASPRYGAARAHFDAAQQALDATPPATREAIRQTFECVETLFKLMFPDVARLGASEVVKKLKPFVEARLSGTERNSAGRLVESFKEWVNGAHPYRHGQGVEAVDNPSVPTSVLSVSQGASFARWLAELDGRA